MGLRSCLDFGKFFLFIMGRLDLGPEERCFTGTVFDAVDKKTGRCYKYDITTNPSAYQKAKRIDIKSVLGSNLI